MNAIIDSGQLIVHISGPSACGKSSFAKELAKKFEGDIAIKDSDEFLEPGTATAAQLDKLIDEDEYTALWLKTLVEGARDFLAANKHKKIVVFVGFFDFFALEDGQYVEQMTAYTNELYYLSKPTNVLLTQFFERAERVNAEKHLFDNGSVPRISDSEFRVYELCLRAEHEKVGFVNLTKEQILQRIDNLHFKIDTSKVIGLWKRSELSKSRCETLCATLIYRPSDKIDSYDEIEIQINSSAKKVAQRTCTMPLNHGIKTWKLAQKMFDDGVFFLKNRPNYQDCVMYNNMYAAGDIAKPLIKMICTFVK